VLPALFPVGIFKKYLLVPIPKDVPIESSGTGLKIKPIFTKKLK
jgi:hypothetical protein